MYNLVRHNVREMTHSFQGGGAKYFRQQTESNSVAMGLTGVIPLMTLITLTSTVATWVQL